MVDVEEYNEDELVAPEWLNEKFFEKILNEEANEQTIKVKHVDVKPGSKKGDHYASVMFRITVNYDTLECVDLERILIVKIMPFLEGPKKDCFDATLFETEIKMYNEVIPKFEKTLRDVGDNTHIGGKCLYAALEPHPILIFEDLTKQNYKPVSTWNGDWEITKKAVDKLARWHAISYKSFIDGNTDLQKFSTNVFSGEKMIEFPSFASAFQNFIDMLKEVPEFHQYIPKFEKLAADRPLVKVQNIYKSFFIGGKSNLFVLTHCDFHIKNLMYLENEAGEVEDVKLIDFQLCMWAPAIIDLICMIYLCLDSESRIERRNEIIYYYYRILVDTLTKIGFEGDIPKLTDIYEDMITFKDFEIFILVTDLTFVFAFQEDPSKMSEDAFTDINVMKSFYKNPKYIDYLRRVLPSFLHTGFLD